MSAIFQCQLFQGFTLQEINQFLRRFSIETITYQKGDLLVNKNEPVNAIGIIESGEVEEIGKGLLRKAGNTFGENLLSLQKTLPTLVNSLQHQPLKSCI